MAYAKKSHRPTVPVPLRACDFDNDHWELYNVDADFSQSNDLASREPEKLREMVALWWSEAAKHGALPLLEAENNGRRKTYEQFWKVED